MDDQSCHRTTKTEKTKTTPEERLKEEAAKEEKIKESGQLELTNNQEDHILYLLSIIGEIEGHECLSSNAKTTKYEHVLPKLAEIEDSRRIEGLSKPTVSLVLGGSHSIGVPLAVSTDYSFIVPSGTMVIHPVRMSGTVIGAQPTYDYFKQMQDRILHFIASHSRAKEERLEEMMMNTGMLTKDLGTILIGERAVEEGLINAVGGIKEAFFKLHELVEDKESFKKRS